jgi:hypothetical protein
MEVCLVGPIVGPGALHTYGWVTELVQRKTIPLESRLCSAKQVAHGGWVVFAPTSAVSWVPVARRSAA